MDSPHIHSNDARETPLQQQVGGPGSPATQFDEEDIEPVVVFEPFEPGNLWTQRHPTQFQRKQWRKRVYLEEEEEEEEDGAEIVMDTQAVLPLTAATTNTSAKGMQEGRNEGQNRPWWSAGKTAPLLSDFDSDRRSFYFAQAGIGSSGNGTVSEQSTHCTAGRGSEVVEDRQVEGEGAILQRPVAVVLGKDLRLLQQQSAPPTAVTPGRKTWNAIWGQDGQRSVTNSDKKKKRSSPSSKKLTATTATPSRAAQAARVGKTGIRGGRKST